MIDSPPSLRKNRATRTLIIGIAFILLLGFGIFSCFAVFFFRDDVPPNDQDVLPQWRIQGRTTNPLAKFQDWVTSHPLPTEDPVLSKLLDDPTWDGRAAGEMLAAESERLKFFDQFMTSAPDTWLWKDDDGMAHMAHKVPYLTQIQKVADLVRLRAKWYLEEGRFRDSLRDCENLMKLGRGLQQAEGGLIHYLVGVTIHAKSCLTIESVLSRGEFNSAELALLAARLKALSPSTKDMEFAFRVDFLSFKRVLDELEVDPGVLLALGNSEDSPWGRLAVKMELRKNRALTEKAIWVRELFGHFSSPWPELQQVLEGSRQEMSNIQSRKALLAFGGNWAGSILQVLTRPSEIKIVEKGCTLQVLHQLVLGEITMRLFELQAGKLPAQGAPLDMLPSDFFGNGSLRWDATKRIIYSVGLDGRDDVGEIDLKRPPKGKDIGLPYWWATPQPKE